MESENCFRLGKVFGYLDRCNEVLYSPPKIPSKSTSLVVFFGGDLQDFPEMMSSHRDHGKFIEWNLVSVTQLLATCFISSHIFVVKPNRMEVKTFSCYDNFVESNNIGSPTHVVMHFAMNHLKMLLDNALVKGMSDKNSKDSSCSKVDDNICFASTSFNIDTISLIGFSKGCVVLNQIITEIHTILKSEEYAKDSLSSFIKKIVHLYWLDGGHSGGKNTWITESSILETLASLQNIDIYVYVTPYQICDDNRPWIRKENKQFVATLRRFNANLTYKVYFEEEAPSLLCHFKLLQSVFS